MMDWYYVQGNERVGPISEEEISKMVNSKLLGAESFVWKKGLDNWMRLKATDLKKYLDDSATDLPPSIPPIERVEIDWKNIKEDDRIFSIKVGLDRGGDEAEYGPYSIADLKSAYNENRINAKTFIFAPGMDNWQFLGDLPLYRMHFSSQIPEIDDSERRQSIRKPFVARMLFHDAEKIYEGICRDISVGGLQVLVAKYPGAIGDTVTLNVHPQNNDHSFVAKGKIVRKLDGDQGFSLRFEGLSFEAQKSISTYIKEQS